MLEPFANGVDAPENSSISTWTVSYTVTSRPNYCSHCGVKIGPDWNYCAGCGRAIAAAWPTVWPQVYPTVWPQTYPPIITWGNAASGNQACGGSLKEG